MNTNNNNFKGKKNDNRRGNNNFHKKFTKPRYVKVNVQICDSDFYASNLDSLYNLLDSISFNKVAIPVHMNKSIMFNNDQLKGTAILGTITKFNTDNTFTISIPENMKEVVEGKVMDMRCAKDKETGEITFIYNFNVVEGTPANAQYSDVEQAMLAAAEEAEATTTEETTEE